jgi:solute carrier family 25 (mitochondrial adenine nucleotide translocator), member 4/5/6/31
MSEESKPSPHLGFAENFMLSGAAAIISKTAAAPIERVKLLVQNQGEMLKTGRLDKPYAGVIDCTVRTFRNEGIVSSYQSIYILWAVWQKKGVQNSVFGY